MTDHAAPGGGAPARGLPPVQLAAGGLLWRVRDGERVLGIVHRPRGDWVLPKGGVEAGESLEQAARREVKEETGVDAEITGFAGTIHFDHDGVIEIVAFWHMRAGATETFTPGTEIDALEWVSPGEAMARLTHERERSLLSPHTVSPPAERPVTGARRWWRAAFDPSGDRLRTVIPVVRLEHRAASEATTGAIRMAFEAAEAASARGETETAWLYLKLADRLQILCAGDDEIEVRAAALREEAAEKLGSWRAKTVVALLAQVGPPAAPGVESAGRSNAEPPSDCPKDRRRVFLYEATRIRDEAADNAYRRLALLRRNRTLLLPVVIGSLVALLVLVARGVSDFGAQADSRDAGFIAAVALLGTLGASISAIQSLGQASGQRMPEALTSAAMTLTRPAVGAGAALAAFVIAEAGFPQLDTTSGYVLLALGFVAGFSERFIVGLVETTTRR